MDDNIRALLVAVANKSIAAQSCSIGNFKTSELLSVREIEKNIAADWAGEHNTPSG